MADEATPGWKTSEFWLTLIFTGFAFACVGLELWRGKLGLESALVLAAAAVAKAGYSVSRGMVKSQDLNPVPPQNWAGPLSTAVDSVTELLKAKTESDRVKAGADQSKPPSGPGPGV